MDFVYDGQIRRYVTQFMRIFIGFKYRTGGTKSEDRHVPVMYGDMTRQVASIIKDNSENKMSTVPRFGCYITGLEMDRDRTSDSTFVSKINIRQRSYTGSGATVEYQNTQGGNYTVERLMPSPYTLTMKTDLWTSNTDQKLQLIEQILMLFNPTLELQTNDNFVDWTSLSVVNMKNITFTSRQIPQGLESEIDVCSLEFTIPIWISPPAKVKKMGIVQSVIANVFTESGDLVNIDQLIFDHITANVRERVDVLNFKVALFKAVDKGPNVYELTSVDSHVNWHAIVEAVGKKTQLSQVHFTQPSGYDMVGTFEIYDIDPTIILVTFDQDTVPSNTIIESTVNGVAARGTIDAIIDPYKFNPLEVFGSQADIPVGIRYLILDDVNSSINTGTANYDGPDAWKNSDGSDPVIHADSLIEWNGSSWVTVWSVNTGGNPCIQNLRTGIKYRWNGTQWLKAFEGEYAHEYWGFKLDA
jgi:hypothetical protein